MKTRKILVAVTGLATAGALVGLGVGASFTDSVTATQNASVGTFGLQISSAAPAGAVISPDKKSVTLTTGPLMSSVAGTAPLSFTVKSTGNIPVKVHLTQTVPALPFTSRLLSAPDVTLNPNGTNVYDAGLQWPELVNADAGKSATVVYTVSGSEVAASQFTTLIGAAGHYDQYSTWVADPSPVVDALAGTITWTIPVSAANSPTVTPAMSGPVPAGPQGRFTVVPVSGNVSTLANVSLSSGLAADGAKFHAIYRSTTYGTSYNNLSSAPGNVENAVPFSGLNLATTGWANNPGYGHNATDNGLGVTWAGVTGTGTVTIVLAFSTN